MTELKATVEDSGSLWVVALPAIITGTVGFLAAFIPAALLERRREIRQYRTLRASLIAEISAMSELMRSRGYLEDLQAGAEGGLPDLSVKVPSDYFKVFNANVDKLGLLEPEEASRIVQLYQLVESVIQDVIPGGILYTGEGGKETFQQDLAFLKRALDLADRLIADHAADQQRRRMGALSAVNGWSVR